MVTGMQFRQIDFFINIVAATLGIFANVLLIFLLSNTRVPELKNCSRIIFQIAIIDIISSVIMVIVMPIAIVINGHEFFFQNGPLQNIPQPWNHMLILLWFFFHLFSLSIVPVQFVFRYLILCKNKTITNKLYASLFLIPFFMSFIHICIAYFKSYPNLNYSPEIAKELGQYFDSNDTSKIVISSGGEHALTPIVFLIAPTFAVLILSFTKQTTTPELNIFLTMIAWPPFVNAMFALITLKPLRRKFLRYFKEDVDSSSATNIPKISILNKNSNAFRRHSCIGPKFSH
uniref:Uncharacterized protein n=1 Tax=Panagrolaimus davidi TaxID=227884 RepID=A0A914PFR8_9BILA